MKGFSIEEFLAIFNKIDEPKIEEDLSNLSIGDGLRRLSEQIKEKREPSILMRDINEKFMDILNTNLEELFTIRLDKNIPFFDSEDEESFEDFKNSEEFEEKLEKSKIQNNFGEEDFQSYFEFCDALFKYIDPELIEIYEMSQSITLSKFSDKDEKYIKTKNLLSMLRILLVNFSNDIYESSIFILSIILEDDELFFYYVEKCYLSESDSEEKVDYEAKYNKLWKDCDNRGSPIEVYLMVIFPILIAGNFTVSLEKFLTKPSVSYFAFKAVNFKLYFKFISCCSKEQLEIIERCGWVPNFFGSSGEPESFAKSICKKWRTENKDVDAVVERILNNSVKIFIEGLKN